jgi:hypothetical protein
MDSSYNGRLRTSQFRNPDTDRVRAFGVYMKHIGTNASQYSKQSYGSTSASDLWDFEHRDSGFAQVA